ncbi:MAG: eukaryotic-like serine/threonine-protein kinase, partial [Solirubrobacteraceae bacterium]|nr:eukaryotic-like serine/threonine-protein kinase [Solirubrobacteraceae bacterium]
IDQDISDWIDRMLVKDPTKRTQNANEAWDEFEEIIIGLLGPRWRREARLREGSAQFDTPAPLTPAPFQGTTSDAAVSDQFQSFAWGNAVTPDAPAPPGPDTPPPSDSAPLPPEPTVGPPTPAPGPAVGTDGTAPDSDGAGFVTFGAPAAPEAAEVAQDDPPAAEAEAPTVEESQPTEPHTEPQENEGFETYIAPAPLRPPTDDAPPEAPAIPEPTPEPEPVAAAPPPPAPVTPPPAPAATPLPPLDDDNLAATVMPASVSPPPVTEPAKPAKPREVEKPVAKERAEPREKSGRGVLIGFGIAAVVAAVFGFVIGGSGGSKGSGTGKPTAATSNADVEALFPKGWTKVSSAPRIPGMALSEPIAMAPPAAKGAQSVVVGQVKQGAANPTLLPAGFLQALGLDAGELPPRAPVQLSRSKLQAYRYANLRPRGLSKAITLFTVPTSAGVATLACVDPETNCESIANTLKLNAGTAFPVGPNKDYAAALGKTLGGLNKKVTPGRAALQGAKTPKAQAAAAGTLGSAYGGAAKTLAALKVSPADASINTQLSGALKQTGQAYGKLAAAARSGNKSGYAKARTTVQRGEQAVANALQSVQTGGYKIAK